MVSGTTSGPIVRPVCTADLPGVAQFLASNMPSATPADQWVEAWRAANNLPSSGAPNHGMLLQSGDEIVGVYAAIYSIRGFAHRPERFCNLAVWCVQPEYRARGWSLLRALLSQQGYHFTDLNPSDVVQKLNIRLGFSYLETRSQLAVNLPWRARSTVVVSSDPDIIGGSLTGDALVVYRDHARAKWARHAVIVRGDEACYVQWRVARIRGRDRLAEIQYASNPELLRAAFLQLSGHLLISHNMLFTVVEERVSGGRVRWAWSRRRPARKMFKSETLAARDIDYLYSEITAQP